MILKIIFIFTSMFTCTQAEIKTEEFFEQILVLMEVEKWKIENPKSALFNSKKEKKFFGLELSMFTKNKTTSFWKQT